MPLALIRRRARHAQSENCDLGRAVEAEGEVDRSDAAIDVKLQVPNAKPSTDIFPPKLRKMEWGKKRQANLTAMGMAAEHETDRLSFRFCEQIVDVVGSVAEENDRLVREIANRLGNGSAGIRVAADRIVNASEPESAPCALDGKV